MAIFKAGDKVQWVIRRNGVWIPRMGMVLAVVPPGVDPEACIPPGNTRTDAVLGSVRNHHSYLVKTWEADGRTCVFWPKVAKLYPAYGDVTGGPTKEEMLQCIRDLYGVVNDVLPQIGKIVLQDYARLNTGLIAARKIVGPPMDERVPTVRRPTNEPL